jgi:hypothetical protein
VCSFFYGRMDRRQVGITVSGTSDERVFVVNFFWKLQRNNAQHVIVPRGTAIVRTSLLVVVAAANNTTVHYNEDVAT